jgi:replicative DNA helicase
MTNLTAHEHHTFDQDDTAPAPVPQLFRPAAEVVDETLEELHLRNQYPDLGGLRTGLEAFDRHAREALMPGSLIVVAGESGRGKTAFMTQLAVSFSAQAPTLLVTLEDGGRSTIKRALANVSRENVGAIRAGFAGKEGLPASVITAAETIKALGLDVIDGVALTVEAIARQVWEWKKARAFDTGGVVLIDQLSHIVPSDPGMAGYFRQRNLPTPPPANAPETKQLEWQTWVLREVAQRLGVVVVLAHQLNENHAPNQKPTIRSIRGSRGIVHKADLVVIPWRPQVVDNPFAGPGQPTQVPNMTNDARLLGVKGRDVGEFDEAVVWVGAQQRFADPGTVEARYAAPEAPSAHAQEGSRRLAELRARFDKAASLRAAMTAPALGAGAKEDDR